MSDVSLAEVLRLADRLAPSEKERLIEHLAAQLRAPATEPLKGTAETFQPSPSLRGSWRQYFPDDVEIDGILAEVRQEWLEELAEVW